MSQPTEIISVEETKRGELHDLRMALVDASFREASRLQSQGWWALWESYSDGSWRTRHANIREWLGDLSAQYSISRGDFFDTMKMVKNLLRLDVEEATVKRLLGKPMTALKRDFDKLMAAGQLLPEAEAAIAQEYGSPSLFVEAVAGADPGTGRAMVARIVEKDAVFFIDDPVFTNTFIMSNLRHENEEGLQGIYTLTLTVRNITEGQPVANPRLIPAVVANWLAAKLGLRKD